MTRLYEVSVREFLADIHRRIGRVDASLKLLKNQDSEFADAHRRLLKVYRAALTAAADADT